MFEKINIPRPEVGYKAHLINKKGSFILEKGPTILHTFNCTAAGSGGFALIDGIPDASGYFPEANTPVLNPSDDRRNGRLLLEGHPACLGAWNLDARIYHGLCVVASGGHEAANTFATVTWDVAQNLNSGNKTFFWNQKGTVLLEEGTTDLRGIAITHAGAGSLIVFDGVPSENGYFPDEFMHPDDPDYSTRNGRPIFEAHPPVVQMWYPRAGTYHGLSIRCMGGHGESPPQATVVWMPSKIKK